MQLEYIEENLNEVIQKSDNVMYLKSRDIGNKRALFAFVKEDEGVYKKIQITKAYSKMTFPFEPVHWFYTGPGHFLLKNFISFNSYSAFNIKYLDGFKSIKLDEIKIFRVGIFATFIDGSATFIESKTEKEFNKKGGIQTYIDELKKYKDYNPRYEEYQIIESFGIDDATFIIPELQAKTNENPMVKKLTKKKNF